MKQLLRLTLIILFVCNGLGNLQAQVTLTNANSGLRAGDQFLIHEFTNNSSNFYYSARNTPGNQIWDFSMASPSGTQNVSVLNRSAAPNPGSLPTANAVLDFKNGPWWPHLFSYIETTAGFSRELGNYNSNFNLLIKYSDPVDRMRYPFTFNNNYSDTFSGNFTYNGDSCVQFGTITVVADGYGTIITPDGTFHNTIRIKTGYIENDSCPPHPFNMGNYRSINVYDWYAPGIHFPVFRVLEHHVMLAILYSGFYLDTNFLGLKKNEDNLLNFNVYPNPASDKITLQFELIKANRAKISLVNILGQEVKKIELESQNSKNHTLKLDLSTYPKGVYFIQVQTGDRMAIRKLIIK